MISRTEWRTPSRVWRAEQGNREEGGGVGTAEREEEEAASQEAEVASREEEEADKEEGETGARE